MRRILRLGLVAALVSISIGSARAQDMPPIDAYVLDNGLQVVLAPDPHVPLVALSVAYKVGSMNEPPGRSGFAHLFEHLMFTGTQAFPDFDAATLAVGIENNAYTTEDQTVYYMRGTASTLPVMLSIEADRLVHLGGDVDQAALDAQRSIVQNEMREKLLDAPGVAAGEALWTGLFPSPLPYSRSVFGSLPDLDAATLADVQGFFARYYVPNNAVLVIVGDFDVAATRALVEQTFGLVPRGADVPRTLPVAFEPTKVDLHFTDQLPTPEVSVGFTGPAANDPAQGALRVADQLLSNQDYGFLRQELVNTGIATDAWSYYVPGLLGGRLVVQADAADGVGADQLRQAMVAALEKFAKTPVDPAEVARARFVILLGDRTYMEAFSHRAQEIARLVTTDRNPLTVLEDDPDVAAADAAAVDAVIAATIDLDKASWAVVEPGARGDFPPMITTSSGVSEPLPAAKPASIGIPLLAAGPPPEPRLPQRQVATLANGLELVYYRIEDAPMMNLAVTAQGGLFNEPAGQEGLYGLATEVALHGAGALDYPAYARAATDLGATLSALMGEETANMTVSVPAENFAKGVDLLTLAIERPRFEQSEWDLLVSQTLDDLEWRESDVGGLAGRAIARLAFPVAAGQRAMDVSIASVESLTLDQAKAAYAALFNPQNTALYAVGPLPLDAVVAALETSLGQWTGPGAAVAPLAHPPAGFTSGRKIYVVPEPGTTQAAIAVAVPMPGVEQPRNSEAVAVMRLLGVDFISRLNSVLREEKGYSYGVDAGMQGPNAGDSALFVSTAVDISVLGPAVEEIVKGFAGLKSHPVTQDEVDRTVLAYRTMLAGASETSGGLFGLLLNAVGSGDTLEEVQARELAMTRIALDPVRAEATGMAGLDPAIIVIAGDGDIILEQLAAIGIADAVVLPREDLDAD